MPWASVLVLPLLLVLGIYCWAPAWLLDGAMAVARWKVGLRPLRVDVGADSWAYLDSGGDDVPIVLVHGYASNKESWLAVAGFFKGRGFRLLIPDLPGFGQSPAAADGEYDVASQAERLRGFIQALQLGRVHLIGHSMGGYVAGAYVALYPEDLLSTYLVAPAGVNGGLPPLLQQKAQVESRNLLFVDSVQCFHRTMSLAMVKPPRVPQQWVKVIVAREAPYEALRQVQTGFWFSAPLEHMLRGCRVPLRLCWGELDQLLPVAGAQVLLNAMPSASLKRLPGVGHIPLMEAPKRLAQDYLSFIS
ncbi:alpha/beta fold hydrolase [Pseudomonas sp. LB3P14]